MKKVKVFENIKEVIFNKPDTIIIFKDGSRLVTKCSESDVYDPFVGYLVVLAKYVLPNKYSLVKLIENMYYPDIYFTNWHRNNVIYTILNDKTNNSKYVTDDVNIPGDSYYDYETRKLICLLKCFANNYDKYKDKFIVHLYNMLKTAPTMTVYRFRPGLSKLYEDRCYNVNVPLFAKKIDYTKYNIGERDSAVNNADVYTRFLTAFNATGKCSVDEYRWHGLLGLMSELGELKEVLTEIVYTANTSDEMIVHMHKELSDICWMLCEYTTYSDVCSYSFATYIEQSILFHLINDTKHFDYNNHIPYINGPYNIAIDVVDKIILNVSKIANIYQKMLQGHNFKEFEDQHFEVLFDIYKNVIYLSQYILYISLTNVFSISMDKVKKRYPDGWMDPERSINRKPEDV